MAQEGEFFDFYLADRLHKTPAEIRAMPARDYVALQAFYEIKGIMTDLAVRTEEHRT